MGELLVSGRVTIDIIYQNMSGWLDKDASDAKVQVPHHSSRCDTLHTSSVINHHEKKHMSRFTKVQFTLVNILDMELDRLNV